MKFKFFLILLLLLIPAASAIQINMNSQLGQDSTLLAQVSGNFVNPLNSQNVLLYNGHVRVSFIPTVTQQGSDYYIYGQLLNKPEGNYSLTLSNVKYYQTGKIETGDVSKNFTITNQTADFSVDPGFVSSGGDFYINVESMSGNTITINYFLSNGTVSQDSSQNKSTGFFGSFFSTSPSTSKPTSQTQSITLNPGQTKKILFAVGNSNSQSELTAVISSTNTTYNVPVFISGTTSTTSSNPLKVQPSNENIPLSTNSSTTRYFYISNSGNTSLNNVSFYVSKSISPYVSVLNQSINLPANTLEKIIINITSGASENVTEGTIVANTSNWSSSILLSLNFTNSYIPPQNSSSNSVFPNCSDIGGVVCSSSQVCNGQSQNIKDGECCLATCVTKTSPNNTGKIIGWIALVLFVVFITFYLIKRYKKAKGPTNPLDAMKKKK